MRRRDRPIGIKLPCHALEVGRAFGPDHDLRLLARRSRQPAHNLLVRLSRDICDLLAPPGADQKEYIQDKGAHVFREGYHIVKLMRGIVGHREMDLKAQIIAATGIEGRHGLLPTTRQATEGVMVRRFERIQADPNTLKARRL